MKRRRGYHDIRERARKVIRFERFYAPRLREAIKAAFVNDVNAAELGVLHLLRDWPCPPGWLSWRLDMDPGYVSRILAKLEWNGLIVMSPSASDGRGRTATLTDRGRAATRYLEQFHEERAQHILEGLPVRQQERLVRAMAVIVEVLTRDELANVLECIREA